MKKQNAWFFFAGLFFVTLLGAQLAGPSVMLSRTRNHVTDFNLKGDGKTDNSANMAKMILAMQAYDTIVFPNGTFKFSTPIVVTKPLYFVGEGSPLLWNTADGATSNSRLFYVQSDCVGFEGLRLRCHAGTDNGNVGEYEAYSQVIYAEGSKSDYLDGLYVQDCLISDCSFGFYPKYVTNWAVVNTEIRNVGYAGIHALSVKKGAVTNCRIHDQLDAGAFGYGTAISSDPTVSDPRSEDVVHLGNHVWNIPWEGMDGHGCLRCSWIGNTVYNAERGIVSTTESGDPGTPNYGSTECNIIGNHVDSGVTDGSRLEGLLINGTVAVGDASTSDPESVGNVVSGNTVIGYGTQSEQAIGGINFHNTRGTICTDNYIKQPSPSGIVWNVTNRGFVCTGNIVEDAWSSTFNAAYAVHCYAEYNEGLVANNFLRRGSKSATYVNSGGARITSTLCKVTYGINDFTAISGGGVKYIDAFNQGRYVNLAKRATTTWNPPALAYGEMATTNFTCTGAAVGDQVVGGFGSGLPSGVVMTLWISSANTVYVTLVNRLPGSAVDLANDTITVDVYSRDW